MVFAVNEDFVLEGVDSLGGAVDLSAVDKSSCMSLMLAKSKVLGKSLVLNISVAVNAGTGLVKTSLVNGSSVSFTSATGVIAGSSAVVNAKGAKLVLFDSSLTVATAMGYVGKGSMGVLTVTGVENKTGTVVVDVCKFWVKKAGQDKVKGK